MAKTFTSPFSYNNKEYMAVITQLDGSVKIYLPDESLHSILPQGKFIYYPGEGLELNSSMPGPLQKLLQSIVHALELENLKHFSENRAEGALPKT